MVKVRLFWNPIKIQMNAGGMLYLHLRQELEMPFAPFPGMYFDFTSVGGIEGDEGVPFYEPDTFYYNTKEGVLDCMLSSPDSGVMSSDESVEELIKWFGSMGWTCTGHRLKEKDSSSGQND